MPGIHGVHRATAAGMTRQTRTVVSATPGAMGIVTKKQPLWGTVRNRHQVLHLRSDVATSPQRTSKVHRNGRAID